MTATAEANHETSKDFLVYHEATAKIRMAGETKRRNLIKATMFVQFSGIDQ